MKYLDLKNTNYSVFYCKCAKEMKNNSKLCEICKEDKFSTFTQIDFKTFIYLFLVKHGLIIGGSGKFNCCFYTDGVSPFKNGKKCFWPLYLISTDIKYPNRFKIENIILLGIWYGEFKPQVQVL